MIQDSLYIKIVTQVEWFKILTHPIKFLLVPEFFAQGCSICERIEFKFVSPRKVAFITFWGAPEHLIFSLYVEPL